MTSSSRSHSGSASSSSGSGGSSLSVGKNSPDLQSLNVTLCVKNLSGNVSEANLAEIFGNYGEVVSVKVTDGKVTEVKDRVVQSKIGYIEFKSVGDALKAHQSMDGVAQIDGIKAVIIPLYRPLRNESSAVPSAAKIEVPQKTDTNQDVLPGQRDSPGRKLPLSPQCVPSNRVASPRISADRNRVTVSSRCGRLPSSGEPAMSFQKVHKREVPLKTDTKQDVSPGQRDSPCIKTPFIPQRSSHVSSSLPSKCVASPRISADRSIVTTSSGRRRLPSSGKAAMSVHKGHKREAPLKNNTERDSFSRDRYPSPRKRSPVGSPPRHYVALSPSRRDGGSSRMRAVDSSDRPHDSGRRHYSSSGWSSSSGRPSRSPVRHRATLSHSRPAVGSPPQRYVALSPSPRDGGSSRKRAVDSIDRQGESGRQHYSSGRSSSSGRPSRSPHRATRSHARSLVGSPLQHYVPLSPSPRDGGFSQKRAVDSSDRQGDSGRRHYSSSGWSSSSGRPSRSPVRHRATRSHSRSNSHIRRLQYSSPRNGSSPYQK